MTRHKDLKRRVRARMQKTGESYTAARAKLIAKRGPDPARFAELAGMSDDAVAAKTSKTWPAWVEALDAIGALGMSHRDIAKVVRERWPEIGGWWAQTVTVGYERIRGLRDKGQQRTSKLYTANKSRTFKVPVSRLYRAFSEKRTRQRWLGELDLTIRTSRVDKSMRIAMPDGTAVQAWFTDKGERSSVAIQHDKLATAADVERAKQAWHARLDALATVL